nr:MBL fold metallo-hydrolase [Candidatus Sigynarchaeota archaeon]
MERNPCTVTVICNNLVDPLFEGEDGPYFSYPRSLMRSMVGEHGLAYLVQVGDVNIVFDTGGIKRTFLNNIQAALLEGADISWIVLSHGHHDHVSGLVPFLAVLKEKAGGTVPGVSCHPFAVKKRYQVTGKEQIILPIDPGDIPALLKRGAVKDHRGVNEAIIRKLGVNLEMTVDPLVVLEDGEAGITVKTTGEIPRIHEKVFYPATYVIEQDNVLVHDDFLDDQALIIEKRNEYAAVLLGCCHAGLENTVARVQELTTLPIKVIIGGFHLTGLDQHIIEEKHAFLEKLAIEVDGKPGPARLMLRPIHCSGERFYLRLKTKGSDKLDVDRLPAGARFTP